MFHPVERRMPNAEQGNFIIVRVWNSRDDKDNIVSASQAWSRKGNIGHVSLEVFKGNIRKYYISFWPIDGVKSHNQQRQGTMIPVSADIQAEGRMPDIRVMIYSVDIQTIENSIIETMGIRDINNSPKWCVTGLNCCTSVFTILKRGILEGEMSINGKVQEELNRLDRLSNNLKELSVVKRIFSKEQREQEFLEPNIVREFVEFFYEKENSIYRYLTDVRSEFEEKIKKKFLDSAKRGGKGLGDLKLYENNYYEIYQKFSTEIQDTFNRAERAKKDMLKYALSGQMNLFEDCKQKNQEVYEANRDEIDQKYQEVLSIKTDILNEARRGQPGIQDLLKYKISHPEIYESSKPEIDSIVKEKMLEAANMPCPLVFRIYKDKLSEIYQANKREIDLARDNANAKKPSSPSNIAPQASFSKQSSSLSKQSLSHSYRPKQSPS